jgi:AcrR family transcriptional regulator
MGACESPVSPDLPSGIALTWGARPERRLGPRPSMTVEEITAAAIAVADEGGLAALSMAAVAQRLGCTKMALYRYVEGKDDLRALMIDGAVGPPPEVDPEAGWRAGLEGWARALLARFLAHPWAVDVPVGGALMTRHQTLWLEAALRTMRPSGLTLPQRLSVALLLSTHVAASARLRRDTATAAPPDPALPPDLMDPEELSDVLEAFGRGHLSDADGAEQEFSFGVTCILDGAAAARSAGKVEDAEHVEDDPPGGDRAHHREH